jgi:hypothetical protein
VTSSRESFLAELVAAAHRVEAKPGAVNKLPQRVRVHSLTGRWLPTAEHALASCGRRVLLLKNQPCQPRPFTVRGTAVALFRELDAGNRSSSQAAVTRR